MKTMITVPLEELRTSDIEGLGSLYEQGGKVYRWVKNKGSTALVASQPALTVFTSVAAAANCRVISLDGAAASTALVTIPAGDPVTAIAASGAGTGDHGWIQVRGIKKVTITQLVTALVGGEHMVATQALATTFAWGDARLESFDSSLTSYEYAKFVQVMQPVATTGAATAVSCVVDIQCL